MCNMIRKTLPKRQKRATNWFGWGGLFRGDELSFWLSWEKKLFKISTRMYFLLRRLIWSVQKIFPEICQRREDWERSINYPGIESSASRYIIEFLVWNMKYEMNLSHSRRFIRSYCRWSVQNKNFGHDPSPRYRGNHGWRNKDILGGPRKVALVEIYVIFAVFAFWGF